MWGLRIFKAKNTLVAITAEFAVTGQDRLETRYRWAGGPHGGTLDRENRATGEWERIGSGTSEELAAILPQTWGHAWTYADFVLALTFWGEGCDMGRDRAMAREWEV